MAIDHYENFPVASWLCPRAIRPAVLSLYGFARYADDVADEGTASPEQRLADLHSLRDALLEAQRQGVMGAQAHPTLHALWPQVQRHGLPVSCLFDLLDAFEQDVRMTADQSGMRSWDEVLDYCQRSANPVGRLMLVLMGQNAPEQLQQSDAICTALQLINFWQDLSIDRSRGRHYLPPNVGLALAMGMTRDLMIQGAPLAWQLSGRMGLELRAVVHGGLRVLELMGELDVTQQRPQLSRWDWVVVATRSLSPFPPKV